MPEKTLYDRLGGDAFINLMVSSFFDEIVEDRELSKFFKHISVSALKTHQVKLFRVIYGKPEEMPSQEELLDFMLATHTRLFREFGMNETHFDKVANCFVQGLQSHLIDQDLIDECVSALVPLRPVFEYGAKVAAQEKDREERNDKTPVPVASAKLVGTDTPAVLPEPTSITIPDWLPAFLKRNSNQKVVRAWTCELTDRFGEEGNHVIADTFLDMPYMNHHVYLVALMELAFLPDDTPKKEKQELIEIVRYPRGRNKHPLSGEVFELMTLQLAVTCDKFRMKHHVADAAVAKLRSCSHNFATLPSQKIGGITASHTLRRPACVEIEAMVPEQAPTSKNYEESETDGTSADSLQWSPKKSKRPKYVCKDKTKKSPWVLRVFCVGAKCKVEI